MFEDCSRVRVQRAHVLIWIYISSTPAENLLQDKKKGSTLICMRLTSTPTNLEQGFQRMMLGDHDRYGPGSNIRAGLELGMFQD